MRKQDVYALIVSPTRELATQICEVLDALLLESPQFSRHLVMGGGDRTPAQDGRRLTEHGANILVATPGRLHDLLQRRDTGPPLQAAVKALVRRCRQSRGQRTGQQTGQRLALMRRSPKDIGDSP